MSDVSDLLLEFLVEPRSRSSVLVRLRNSEQEVYAAENLKSLQGYGVSLPSDLWSATRD